MILAWAQCLIKCLGFIAVKLQSMSTLISMIPLFFKTIIIHITKMFFIISLSHSWYYWHIQTLWAEIVWFQTFFHKFCPDYNDVLVGAGGRVRQQKPIFRSLDRTHWRKSTWKMSQEPYSHFHSFSKKNTQHHKVLWR